GVGRHGGSPKTDHVGRPGGVTGILCHGSALGAVAQRICRVQLRFGSRGWVMWGPKTTAPKAEPWHKVQRIYKDQHHFLILRSSAAGFMPRFAAAAPTSLPASASAALIRSWSFQSWITR